MIKFKNLLKEGHGGRSEPIDKEEFKSILSTKASAYSIEDGEIFRGIGGFGYDFAKIDPRDYKSRKSRYADTNYYTLIINNQHNWKKYPEREIICTTSSTKASSYGDVYMVIPYNGVKWGICPQKDIFYSFDKLKDTTNFYDVNEFLWFVKRMFYKYLGSVPNDYFQSLEQYLQHLGMKLDEIGFFDETDNDLFQRYEKMWKSYQNSMFFEYNEFDEFVFDLLDPVDNGFGFQSDWKGAPENREVWTDGPCLLIDYMYYRENVFEFDI